MGVVMRPAEATEMDKVAKIEVKEGADAESVARTGAGASSASAASSPAAAVMPPVPSEGDAAGPNLTFGWARPPTLGRATATTA